MGKAVEGNEMMDERTNDILRRAGYGVGSEPAKVEVERKPFYIVCGGCGNPYRVVIAEKERIKRECPLCGNPIDVARYKNRLFEIINEEWKEMVREQIWRVAG